MKRIGILLLVLIILGVIAWQLNEKQGRSTVDMELIDFAVSDTAAVNRIYIAKTDGSTIDLKREGSIWKVNDKYQAKKVNVDLLLKCFKRVEVRSPVPAAARETVIKNMSSKGTKVEIYTSGDEPVKTWIIGSSTQDHFGTYMLLETPENGRSTAPFVMGMTGFRGFLTPRFHTILPDWRHSEVVALTNLRSITKYSVKNHLQPEESFSITLKGETFGLFDGNNVPIQNPDTGQLGATLVPLKKLHYEFFESFLDERQRDSVLTSQPMYEMSISLADGAEKQITFWKRKPPTATYNDEGSLLPIDPDRMFTKTKFGELVVVQRHLYDRALPLLSDLH